MPGLFITFEGGEGAGKSTQIKRLAAHLKAQGRDVLFTREPGGTPSAEQVRALLVNGDASMWSSTAEALLNYAARDAHLRHIIRPALLRDQTVLCDRFMDSTRAYQGVAGDCPMSLIDTLEEQVVGATRPDLTLIFDLDPALGLARAKQRGAGIEDRYERKGLKFHEALRMGFLDIAKRQPERCGVLDASQEPDDVWTSLLSHLKERGHG
jgi:dTMP kinase